MTWKKSVIAIADDAREIDLDGFEIDLGVSVPVATFQVKQDENACCTDYQIYSIAKEPGLLRTLTGAESFSAADTDLDGRLEIWADDAAAVQNFEHLSRAELSPPRVVLRFEGRSELLDVSSEFQAYYDKQIALARKELTAATIRDFMQSGQALVTSSSVSAEKLHQLRAVKAKILEIVWGYLYSGRPDEAWRELAAMWPESDRERIRAAILDARVHGLLAQTSSGIAHRNSRRRKKVPVYDATNPVQIRETGLVLPAAIMLRRPPPLEGNGKESSDAVLELVIDSAGKVRSAEAADQKSINPILLEASKAWKFMPAFKNGKPVASRIRMSVWALQ